MSIVERAVANTGLDSGNNSVPAHDVIVQFVGFETITGFDEFIVEWKQYANSSLKKDLAFSLQQQLGTHCRYKYISRNEWPEDNFQFVFMEGRLSDHFHEGHVRVVQAGGYIPLQVECNNRPADAVTILTFLKNASSNPDSYKSVQAYQHLNIYEAYYESCVYAYILEFFVLETDAMYVIQQLKNQSVHVEIGMYKECLLLKQ